ncbi:MAG TPA: winged helix DNA-binding domain-containing protein [Nocardioidaceae bacterium]|nr:winged helix DNA-binding domain-containing protein [Nocardioidaceae bacterium]
MRRHGLSDPVSGGPADVAAAMCGAHAQVMSAAELSLGIRLPETTRAGVRDALWTERSLVKTFGPRGTVHLLPTRDLELWTGALSAIPAPGSPMPVQARMTADQTDAVVHAIDHALSDAELTVDELTEAVVEATGPWAGDLVMPAFQGMWPRWRQVISTAANRGALVFGHQRGRQVTYTSPRRWLPGFSPMAGPQATAELTRRYLRAYGPARPEDFARWLNASRTWAQSMFDALGDEVEEVHVEHDDVDLSHTAWQLAADEAAEPAAPDGVRLLPYFDAYSVGCHPRPLVFPGKAADRALARGQAGNYPVLLVEGTAAGVWHLRRQGRRLAVTVEPLGRLTRAHRSALEQQVERLGGILEGSPTLTVGTVTVGPHA